MYGDRAVVLLVVNEVSDKTLDVSVEDQAHELGLAVDHRRAGVAADNVAGGDEVERGGEIQLGLPLQESRGQIKRRLQAEARPPPGSYPAGSPA